MTSPAEFAAAMVLLGLLILLKILNTARYEFDSDESQHLHVIWGWARGFWQYRDLCDNHMPLFQMLFAPVYWLIGDRATVLNWMRFVLLPGYAVVAWCSYRIGTLLFSKRTGIWAVIAAGFYPGYHFCSLEFRTDNLWATFWLLSVLTVVRDGLTTRSTCVAGLLLGLCFGVSMKTLLLLMSLLGAIWLSVFLIGTHRIRLRWRDLVRWTLSFVGIALLIPGLIIAVFALKGIGPQLRYWVFENNIVPGLRNHPAWWVMAFPLAFPALIYAARKVAAAAPDSIMAFRRSLLLLICGFYISCLWSFWPLVTRQDYVPHQPLAYVFYTAALLAISDWLIDRRNSPATVLRWTPLPALVAIAELLVILVAHPFWVDGAKRERDLLSTTLKLTDPGDYVLDEKGETVFRQRCFGPIWEPFVRERIQRGLMADDGPERCLATRTCLVHEDEDITERTAKFIETYYLPIGGNVRVAGAFLHASKTDSGRFEFEVAIPANYCVLAANRSPVNGWLDARPYAGGHRFLATGRHLFVSAQLSERRRMAVIWAKANDRGARPMFVIRVTPGYPYFKR
jgi:Dolichyl-phosphate-mannose-protein mannosyltransferase